MAAAFFQNAPVPVSDPFTHMNAASPSHAPSHRSPHTPDLSEVSTSPSISESSTKALNRLRSSLEQSLRSAIRPKKIPAPVADDFATVTSRSAKGKELEKNNDDELPRKEKEKSKMRQRLESVRRAARESLSPSPVPLPKDAVEKVRAAGFTSFVTPSMRQGSMSSPSLHIPSHATSSSKSRPPIPTTSGSPHDAVSTSSRDQTRQTNVHPQIGSPLPLGARFTHTQSSRHRSVHSVPSTSTPMPSSISKGYEARPSRASSKREHQRPTSPTTPTPASKPNGQLGRSSSRKASASSGHLPLHPPPVCSVTPRATSPVRPRTARVVTPTQGSPSSSHLLHNPPPTSFSTRRASVDSPRRPSVDSPRKSSTDTARRSSVDATRRTSVDTPGSPQDLTAASGSESPSPRPRPISPNQRAYAQNRYFNMSTTSLTGPPNPEYRELIRTATSMLCKEIIKIPPHLSRSESGIRDWEEVEVRTRALARSERVWGKCGGISGGSSTSLNTAGGSGFSGSAEERERRLFAEALRDGFVLCQLMNKLQSASVVRPDPREEKIVRTANVTKFLAACSSYDLPDDDLFQRDDLIEGTGESLARVARTIIALIKFAENPVIHRSKYIPAQGKKFDSSHSSGPYSQGTTSSSRAASSTPNLAHRQLSPPASSSRKRYSPPSALPTVRSDSHEANSALDDDDGTELEVHDLYHVRVPHIMTPPPRSPLRARSSKRFDEHRPLARTGVSPPPPRSSMADSTRASIGGFSIAESCNVRQSVASTAMSEITMTTDVSSLWDYGRSRTNSSTHNKFGTIRTIATDITSATPSMTRTEASAIAEELARKKSSDSGVKYTRDRKVSDGADLMRVVEENDDVTSSSRSGGTNKTKGNAVEETDAANKPEKVTAVHLRKGKWPEDFMDVFQSRNRPPIAATPRPTLEEDETRSASTISTVSRRKVAIVGAPERSDGVEGLSQFPRRPSHLSRQSLDCPGLLPKDWSSSRDSSPSGLSSSSTSRVVLRRHSTKPSIGNRSAVYISSGVQESPTSANDPLVPFPQASAGDHNPSSLNGDSEPNEKPRVLRGRFRSDIDSASARGRIRPSSAGDGGPRPTRSRVESMINLGADSGNASASDLLSSPRDSVDGSTVRRTLIIREEGKPPIHFQLGNCVGRGQFGSVYRALNLNTGQMVAVKRIRLEGLKEEEIKTLMREVDLVKSLSHPSIVKYEGMARDDDTLSIVLEFAENGSLGQTLKAFGKLNERLVASYVVKILEGLYYLHSSEVVHCDLKAANILTTKNGNVKLSDFGVSLNLRAMEREIKDVAGTPNWMAPEVIELKGPSTKSDIWSLACTVIELLTGRPPYAEITNSMSVMFRIVEDDMPPIPEGSSPLLKDFLTQCFHKEPKMRPSAELLFEHPWLKQNWGLHKELRPQDSIPFLRRISADLQKSEIAKYFPPTDDDFPPPTPADEMSSSPPRHRISDISARFLADNDIAPRDHSFVRTTFSKPMVCRVCLLNVKKSAVLCEQCSLIAHSKCAVNAPPTCDLRAQLLLYAKYAEMGSPLSAYQNPLDGTRDGHPVSPSSDVPYVAHGTTSSDVPPSPLPPSSSTHSSTAHKFLGALAFKRSRSSLSPGSPQLAVQISPHPKVIEEASLPKKGPATSPARPESLASDRTDLSSLRSAATAAESFSSHRARSVISVTGGSRSQGETRSSKIRSEALPRVDHEPYHDESAPTTVPTETVRHRRRELKPPGCVTQ